MQLQRFATYPKRPLLQTPSLSERPQELSEIRTPIYRRCADITLDLSRIPMSQVRHRILDAITEYRAEAQARHA